MNTVAYSILDKTYKSLETKILHEIFNPILPSHLSLNT